LGESFRAAATTSRALSYSPTLSRVRLLTDDGVRSRLGIFGEVFVERKSLFVVAL